MAKLTSIVQRLALNGPEVRGETGWSQAMVNDYLGIQDALLELAAFLEPEAQHLIGAAGEPIFQSGWSNFGSGYHTAAFYLDPFDRVWLRGVIAGGAVPSTVFTLPVGYRPTARVIYPAIDGTAGAPAAQIEINTTGTVRVPVGNSVLVSLDGISFRIN